MDNMKHTEQEIDIDNEQLLDLLYNPMFNFMLYIEGIEKGEMPEDDPKRYEEDFNRVFQRYPENTILRQFSWNYVAGFDAARRLYELILEGMQKESSEATTETTK